MQLAATTVVVAATVITATIVRIATAAVTITAEQYEDYKDDNPCAAITIVEKATHFLNPLSMHNMIFRFFCYKKNIYLFNEKNKTEINILEG